MTSHLGEFVRWDTPIYGRAGGKETIIIDASLCPVVGDSGQVVFICAEGRDISAKKAQEREIAQKNIELQFVPDEGRVRCALRCSAQEILVAVDDSGPGVKPELRSAIFERFRQGDGGINRKVGGTGLGLAIAKEFVEMHKGRIEVIDSELGGARFQVAIPRARLAQHSPLPGIEASVDRTPLSGVIEELRAAMPIQRPNEGQTPSHRKPRVLVVEDNAADEELLVKLLEHGAQDFIVEPFSEKELVVRVRNLVAAQQTHEQVSDLRDAAESANRAKDEFLAMLGYELRNPLAPILIALQLMQLRGEERSARERTAIERQVRHLARLVDDLLDVSRITRGGVELRRELVELSDVVAKAIEMASPLFEQRAHALSVMCRRRACAGDEVVLSVRDTGIGMAADVLPRVFDLFVQERQALDRSQGGLGLDLAIVRNLLERHGGSITAHSEGPGRGSEFVVRLPLATPRAATADSRTPEPLGSTPAATGERVLIVDDMSRPRRCWP